MNDLQRSVLAISTALVFLLATLILRTTGSQAEKVRVPDAKLSFTPSFAYEATKKLATQFPERGMGTETSRAAAQWIQAEMKRLGLRTEQQEFEAWIAGKRVGGRNVIGTDEGIREGAVVIIAHYDIPYHVRQGAMDDASGVGVLLELARVFSREEQKKTLIFVASDGEEWGMLGARHFVRNYADPGKIRAVLSLDYVRVENPERIYIRGEGQFRGYAPLWLWMLAEDCATKAGGEPRSPDFLGNYLARATDISSTDQGPFLRAGVPAINIGGNRADSPLARRIYHTQFDTIENFKPQHFDVYGKTSEMMVRSVDILDYSTDNNPYYLRTSKRIYVGHAGTVTLHIFLFLPLLLATAFQYYNVRTREKFMDDVLVEVANVALLILPWLLALCVLYYLVWQNVIPRYELYPATPFDPFLKNPSPLAVAVVVATLIGGWAAVLVARRFLSLWGRPDFASAKAVCLDTLLTLSAVALALNGFAASVFLAPAALLWPWIEQGGGLLRRAMNIVLFLAALTPLAIMIASFASRLDLGHYIFWYLLTGAGYMFFSPQAVLIAAGAATVGARLLQKSLTKSGTPAGAELNQ